MLGFKGVRGWIVVAAVCGLAAGASAVKAFQPTGPAVGTGVMPLKTFTVAKYQMSQAKDGAVQVFEVPQGQTLVITDLRPIGFTVCNPPAQLRVLADGVPVLAWELIMYTNSLLINGGPLATGVAISAGAKVSIANSAFSNCGVDAVATGYLMRN